jgi:NodT family efflux transporter outer membrane factor (OMF) lipoprotein
MKRTRAIVLGFVGLWASACTVGPDFKRPATDDHIALTARPLPEHTASAPVEGGASQRFVAETALAAQWWKAFGSQALDELVESGLRNNADIQSAEAALRAANETRLAQQAALFPTVTAQYAPSRQKTAPVLSSALQSGDTLYTLHTAQLAVGYTPDVFGGIRRQVELTEAQEETVRFQREAVRLTVASNIVVAAIQEASLRAQVDAAEDVVSVAKRLADATRRQHDAGQLSGAEVAAQEAALAQSEALLPPLRKQLDAQRDLLAVLVGRYPGQDVEARFQLSALQLPVDLPVSLPSSIVEHRPDIRAAEAQVHAASAQVGVAVASRFPAFTLTAAGGSTALEFSKLFSSGTAFWAIAGEISQPVFDAGALRHRQRAAEAQLEQAQAQYRGAVLTAFQNVADVLNAIDSDAQALQAAANAERATARALAIAERQWRAGAAGFAAVLLAQQAHSQAAIALAQARAARFADVAALYQALGGGWWKDS